MNLVKPSLRLIVVIPNTSGCASIMSVPHVTSRRNYFAKNWSRRDQKIILQKKTGNFVEIPTIRKF